MEFTHILIPGDLPEWIRLGLYVVITVGIRWVEKNYEKWKVQSKNEDERRSKWLKKK